MALREEAMAAPLTTKLWEVAPRSGGTALALHGGAGGRIEELSAEEQGEFERGLAAAHAAGAHVLDAGGSALDAVCATVEQLENNALFNAGHGAALTADGEAELDASVMIGTGAAGAIATSLYAKNPVYAARSVLELSDHLLLVAPSRELLERWGLTVVDRDYFVTEARQRQLARVQARELPMPPHGPVGAVARDATGRVAAATSTGGMVNQHMGRVGDTPIIGAGNYARNGLAAVSCTGDGESFIRGVVAYDIAARIRYLGSTLADAVTATIDTELTQKDASGGLVSIDAHGGIVVAHNSPTMFAAFEQDGRLVLLT